MELLQLALQFGTDRATMRQEIVQMVKMRRDFVAVGSLAAAEQTAAQEDCLVKHSAVRVPVADHTENSEPLRIGDAFHQISGIELSSGQTSFQDL